jgi:hypothetical protein
MQYRYLHTSSFAASTFNASTCFSNNACPRRSTYSSSYSCSLSSHPSSRQLSRPHSNKNSTDRMPARSLPTRQLGKDGPQVTAIGFGLMYVTHCGQVEQEDLYIVFAGVSQRSMARSDQMKRDSRFWTERTSLARRSGTVRGDLQVKPYSVHSHLLRLAGADMYGDSEDLVGKWFARTNKRDEIFLATKFANVTRDGQWTVDSSPEYCKEACAKSLKRLGIDCIDLYYW